MKKSKKAGLRETVRRILAQREDADFAYLAENLKQAAKTAPFSERELSRLPDVLQALSADRPNLTRISEEQLTALTEEMSTIHPTLLSQDPIYPREDAKTRELKRLFVERYARLHRIPPDRAAQIYSQPALRLHPIPRALIPMIAALIASLLPAYFFPNGFYLSIFLLLPLFEGFRSTMEQIFLHFGREYHYPALKLSPEELPPLLIVWSGEISKAHALCDRMEQSYLSDHTGDVLFTLILDGKDAHCPELLSDYTGLEAAKEEIERLRARHGDHFVLLWRRRVYCPDRKIYVGCDRDIGIAESLARFCRGQENDVRLLIGDGQRLQNRQFLLILPESGQIPYNSLEQLGGILLHPHNQPVCPGDRVIQGHGGLSIGGEILHGPGETPFSAMAIQNPETSLCLNIDLLLKICQDKPFRFFERDRLSVGYTRQIRMYTSAPNSPIDYFRQITAQSSETFRCLREGALHRCQGMTRGRLFRRILRSLLYPAALICIPIGVLFAGRWEEVWVVLSALSAFLLPILPTLICSGHTFFCRFFTLILPRFWQALCAMLFRISCLPLCAACSIIGILRGFFEKKRRFRYSRRAIYLLLTPIQILPGLFLLTLGQSALMRILGFLWLLFPAFLTAIARKRENPTAGRVEQGKVRAYAGLCWRYFEQFADSAKMLPPDWVCISPYPGRADTGSPSGLGLTLAATLAAYDLRRIDCHTLLLRIDDLTEILETIPKKHGLPYARYRLDGSDVEGDPILSTAECGILAICLICVQHGLESLILHAKSDRQRRGGIVRRLQKLRNAMDFGALAHGKLPYLVAERTPTETQSDPHLADRYASPEMLCVLAGVASGQLSPDFLRALKTAAVERGGYMGITSAHGGLDEYLLPFAFLPVVKGTSAAEAALFALSTQIRTAKRKGRQIFGSGDGGCFSFSTDGSHRPERTHGGDPDLAESVADPDALHPYTSFLALPFLPRRAISNLRTMEKMGALGEYGFYDSIDFSKGRVGVSFAIPEVYFTKHQALSLICAANLLCDRPFEKRLLSDPAISACLPLLQREISDTVPSGNRRKKATSQKEEERERPSALLPLTLCAIGGELSAVLSDVGHFQLRRGGRPINRSCFDPRSADSLCESLRLYARLSDRGFSPLDGEMIYDAGQAFYTLEAPGIVCRTHILAQNPPETDEQSDPSPTGLNRGLLTIRMQCDGGAGSLIAGLFLCFKGKGTVQALPGMNLLIFSTDAGWLGIGAAAAEPSIDLSTDSRVLPIGYTDSDLFAALGSPKPVCPHSQNDLLFGMIRILTGRRDVTFRIAAGDSREEVLRIFRLLAGVKVDSVPPIARPDPAAEWMLASLFYAPDQEEGSVAIAPEAGLSPEKLLPFSKAAADLSDRGMPMRLTYLCQNMDDYRKISRAALPYSSVYARLFDSTNPIPAAVLHTQDSITELCMNRPAVKKPRAQSAPAAPMGAVCPYGNDRIITLLSPHRLGCSYLGEGQGQPLTLPPYGALGDFVGERLLFCGEDGRRTDLLAASCDCEFTDSCALYPIRSPFSGEIRVGCDPERALKLILITGVSARSLEISVLPFGREPKDRDIRISRDSDTVFFLRQSDSLALFVSKFPLDGGVGILIGAFSGENQREYYEIREKYQSREDFLAGFEAYRQSVGRLDSFTMENGLPSPDFVRKTLLWNRLYNPDRMEAFDYLLLYDPDGYRQRLIRLLGALPASGEYPASAAELCVAAGRYLNATEDRDFLEIPLAYADLSREESVYLHLIRILDGVPKNTDLEPALTLLSPYLPAESLPDLPKSASNLPIPVYPRLPTSIDGYADYLTALIYGALGLQVYPDRFSLSPLTPRHPIEFHLRLHGGHYRVRVSAGESRAVRLDGEIVNNFVFFQKGEHFLEITVEKFKKKV